MDGGGSRWKQWDTGQSEIPAAYPLSNVAKLKFPILCVTAELTLLFLSEEEEQRDLRARYNRALGWNLLLNQIA